MGNTLSDHGQVNRGVCTVSSKGFLENIVETRGIEKTPEGAIAPDANGKIQKYTGNEIVSMNLWGFKPSCFKYLGAEFNSFLREKINETKSELDIPTSVDKYVKKRRDYHSDTDQ